MRQTSIMDRLKAETRPQHEAMERRVDLGEQTRDAGAYGDLIEAFYGFYAPLEDALSRIDGLEHAGVNLDERRKTGRLEQDLRALGRESAAAAKCEDLPDVRGLPEAFGCLYVLEGATLGGQIIRRHVADRLGLDAQNGCGFFSSYGDRVGEMWNSFRQALMQYAADAEIQDRIVAAAQDTFAKFDDWLRQRGE